MNTSHHYQEGRCAAPPRPDRPGQERNTVRSAQVVLGGANSSLPENAHIGAPTGAVVGLNDGTIFPESHFAHDVSIRSLTARMSSAALERAPLRGSIRAAIVLVDFSDQVMGPNASQRMKDLFFSTGRKISTGSANEYFQEVSGGKVSLTGEVVGPYRMPRKMSDYANGSSGLSLDQPNTTTMAADAFAAARGNINLGPYDNDGNGYVDAFVVVHAGTGAEDSRGAGDIWSVKWTLPTEQSVDNVKVYGFLTVPEDAEMGVCAHELGHLLFGWPDLYDTDQPGPGIVVSAGIGNWCLMSSGNWGFVGSDKQGTTPCHPSAWCKLNQGWINLVNETDSRSLSLSDVKAQQREIHRLWTNGDTTSQECFLIENRQTTGFDASLPTGGLLVWHIDDAVLTNKNEKHPKVGLMQADGLNQLATSGGGRGDSGDPYPGSSNNRSFNDTSMPSSKNYAGVDS